MAPLRHLPNWCGTQAGAELTYLSGDRTKCGRNDEMKCNTRDARRLRFIPHCPNCKAKGPCVDTIGATTLVRHVPESISTSGQGVELS